MGSPPITIRKRVLKKYRSFCTGALGLLGVFSLFEETGDVSPAIQQHGPPRALDAFEEMSLIQSLNKPEMYLEELREELIEFPGTDVSVSIICKTLKRLGFSRKKLR
jgi:transposase